MRVFLRGVVAFTFVGVPAGLLAFAAHYYTFFASQVDFVYLDVRRFEAAVANLPPDEGSWARFLEEEYLTSGSRGFRAYLKSYGLSGAELSGMVARDHEAWASCGLVDQVRAAEPAVRRGLARFEELYSRALFPRIYLVVGSERVAGMNTWVGVVIAAEMFRGDSANCGAYSAEFASSGELACVAMHELVHFNQAIRSPISYSLGRDNLARAIKEGSADVLAELSVGCHPNAEAHAWSRGREAELWAEFQTVLDSHETGDWFLGQTTGERPANLGSLVGYRIVRAFYDRSDDKQEAIREMMNISDYGKFLAENGYPDVTQGL